MVTAWTGRYNRQITAEEQQIYDHLLYWIELESPAAMIERFRTLFIDGVGYPDSDIVMALDNVTSSKQAHEEFRFVLNRCCHILINRWQARSQSQWAIPQLIRLFETTPSTAVAGIPRSRSVRRLRDLILLFLQSEQYLTLRRLAQVLTESADSSSYSGHYPLGTLIRRYPYLYEHCLLSEDSTREHYQAVREIQAVNQRQFEINLSQYVTYQVRRSSLPSTSPAVNNQRLLIPVANPTLLSDRDLSQAIRHYVGRVDGHRTHRDLAHSFLAHSGQAQSYAAFKDDLYSYITTSIDPEYGRQKFNNQLYNHLYNTFPESNSCMLNDFLMVRTCSQLLNFLVVDNPQRPNHYIFIDLITNLGPVLTTGLLLKLVLLCRKIKPSLEKRFSILFNHYESYSHDAVQWLVQALENLNVALTTHFGVIDLSLIH